MAEITAALTLDAGPAKVSTDELGASALKAARSVDTLSASQRELVAKSERVAAMAQSIDIQNRKAVNSYLQEVAAVRATAQQIGVLNEVEQRTAQAAQEAASHAAAYAQQLKALKVEAGLAAASQAELGVATGLTRGGLNSLRSSLTSLVASLAGTAPGVAQFTGVLGSMALGSGVMIGVLAGMAALGFAWDKLTEKARKAKEEHEKAIKVLEDFSRQKHEGPAGEVGAALPEARADVEKDLATIARLQQSIAELQRSANQGAVVAVRQQLEQQLDATRRHYRDRLRVVTDGEAEAQRRIKEANDQAKAQDAASLAERLSFNQKDAAARKAALDMLAKDRAEYARLLKLPNTPDNSAQIAKFASEIRRLDDALHPKAGGRSVSHDEQRDLEAITAVLREQEEQARRTAEAKAEAAANATAGTQQDLAEAQLLLDAIHEGEDAYKAQQREIAILHQLQAEGLTLADAEYQAEKKRLEQLYDTRDAIRDAEAAQRQAAEEAKREQEQAVREYERRVQQVQRTLSRSIEQFLTDIIHRRNPFVALAQAFEAAMVKMIADAIAAKYGEKLAKALGIESPEQKQQKAATTQKQAADEMVGAGSMQAQASVAMLTAAKIIAAKFPGGTAPQPGGETTPPQQTPPPSGPGGTGEVAKQTYLQQFLGRAAAGVAGYGIGYGIGAATQSKTAGAIGGAVSGAALGFQTGGPVGAAIGGIAGFVGGIIGAGDAAKKAAAELARAKQAFDDAFASAQAEVNHDSLAQQEAQVREQYGQLRQLFAATLSLKNGVKAFFDDFAAGLLRIQDLEDKRIAQLEKEAAIQRQNEFGDLEVRRLRAQGKDKEADSLDFQHQQQRERDDFLNSHNLSDPINRVLYQYLLQTQALEAQKFATDQNTKALTDLTTAVHNGPSGFKIEPYIQQYARALPRPGQQPINVLPQPSGPLALPTSPLQPPTLPSAFLAALSRDPMRELAQAFSAAPTVSPATASRIPLPAAPTPAQPAAAQPAQRITHVTVQPGAIQINGTRLTSEQIAKAVVYELDQYQGTDAGLNGDRLGALEKLPAEALPR